MEDYIQLELDLSEEELEQVKRTDKVLGRKTAYTPLAKIIDELLDIIEGKGE